MNQDKRPITIEDLLRLKRAERPPAEFWTEFDRELRAKQLSALVSKRPWWDGLSQVLMRLNRYRLPLGVTTVLAVTFLTVHEHVPSSPEVTPESAMPAMRVAVPSAPAPKPVAVQIEDPVELMPVASPAPQQVVAVDSPSPSLTVEPSAAPAPAPVASTADFAASGEISRMIPLFWSASDEHIVARKEVTPSARYIAANLAAAQIGETIGTALLSVSQGFESRGMPDRTTRVEPLQQMTSPSEFRRSRYLTAMVATTSMDSSERTSARMANRISGDELYEQVHRFGTRRGGFNVKF